ncbi:Inner membrane transport protein YhjV [Paraburkholderia ribeironis]|uniref:Inner membrane transport protein YhjV n=2 Tax=Paraburkholderia ribeironis TaxID=1247936 RepID=A0A1N7SLZ8_9BURK|nr:aromatic amino acid transport family protein [Paraburkholderia ribeironis]SIT48453.1 Inner membrane transport protein YhjV [Paraburkholderia ribeironis]
MGILGSSSIELEGGSVERIPFTAYDAGWVVLCIGMAIGSGIVFMPLQMGVKGFWVSAAALAIAYPAVQFLSNLYIRSLSASGQCKDYTGIITEYLGKNWAAVLSIVYFITLTKAMLAYSTTLTHDGASYLQVFGVTHESLAATHWFPLCVIGAMVAIASCGEKVLFRVSGPLIVTKLAIVVFLGLSMMPYWSLKNVNFVAPENVLSFIENVLVSLPFAVFSIVYIQILNPMNVAFRKAESDPAIATYRALRASKFAYIILIVSVLFFAFSFLFSVSSQDAQYAVSQNISALALSARVIPGNTVKILATTLNVLAMLSAFFGAYLGFHDAMKGIVVNVLDRFTARSAHLDRILPMGIAIGSTLLLTAWVWGNISTMALLQWTSPTFGTVSCLIPCYLVWRVPVLRKFRSASVWFVGFTGLMLISTPLFKLLGH